MDFYGLVQPYRVNRPLWGFEKEEFLKPKKRLNVAPHYNLSVIRMNGTYLEGVDKFYPAWGFVAMAAAFGICFSLVLLITMLGYGGVSVFIAPICIALFLLLASLWLLQRDAFTYTHFPLRLNRQVYVWRRNGTVLKAGWDELYFTIGGSETTWKDLYVAGHVMDADGVTVRETFALGASGEKDQLYTLWEFYRRYMEEGTQAVLSALEEPLICSTCNARLGASDGSASPYKPTAGCSSRFCSRSFSFRRVSFAGSRCAPARFLNGRNGLKRSARSSRTISV